MSSKKEKNVPDGKGKDDASEGKHPAGGPLQRTGKSAESWNDTVGSSLATISQQYLPTNRTILRRYRFLRMNNISATTDDLAQTIGNEVIYIWNCARIPIPEAKYVHKQVKKVIEWWNQSAKKSVTRTTPVFQQKLDELCDIAIKPNGRYNEQKAHLYLDKVMKSVGKQKTTGFEKSSAGEQDWSDDMKFYLDQKGPRLQMMGTSDKKLTQKEKKVYQDSQHPSSSSSETGRPDDASLQHTEDATKGSDDYEVDTDTEDIDYSPSLKKSAYGDNGGSITLTIPTDAMSQLSPLACRLKLSTRQQTAFFAGVIKVGGANLKDTTLSVSTTHRQRHEGIDKKTIFIKENFLKNIPPHMILHWDGKKITYEKKKKKDERIAIIGSFPGVSEGEAQKPDQFLGAPLVEDGTGTVCSLKVVDTLQEWNIPESIIIGMCWDTTASNTGHKKGAATLFESRLMRAILWLACRHHMGELHVKHPDIAVRVIDTKAPEDLMFKRFQAIFVNLPPCNYRLYEWPVELVHPLDFVTTRALDVLQWGTEQMRQGTFNHQRDDYRELCELVVIYLGGTLTRKRKAGGVAQIPFTMRHPGAFHQARFLSKALYLIKISMMMDIIPEDVVSLDKRDSVDRMAKFIALFHAKYFLQAFLPAAGARLDLQYLKDMVDYSTHDAEVAIEVKDSIMRQRWYMTEELSVLSLFDCGLTYQERSNIATTLLAHPRHQYFLPGKPAFLDIDNESEIPDFIGPRSWLFFHLLQKNTDWLQLPSDQWEGNDDYNEINHIVLNLSVTNDTAERAIKKVTDYANSANDGGQRGKIIGVAAWHHTKMSGYTKEEMENAL